MTEEIKYNKDEKWVPYKQLAETPQQTIDRLEQERDELKKTVENQKLEYEELQCDLSEVENACGCYQSENAELKQENKELKEKYSHILELAKTNADSNEYCLQELEKENDSMKKILVDIGFWDVNGNYREDFQTVERSELYGENED